MHQEQTSQGLFWILDAGHAPNTRGKRSPELADGSRLLEWKFAREVCDRVARSLDRKGIAYHVLTPRTLFDLRPWKRAYLANKIAAEIPLPARVVSIHGNADRGSSFTDAHGVTTLYHYKSSQGKELATALQASLVSHSGLADRGIHARDDLDLLEDTFMPAVLAECGFYTHEYEVLYMLSGEGQQTFADGIVDFIECQERAALAGASVG